MVECRHCRGSFQTPPETIGARCPDCRMPLFERMERVRREVEMGRCAVHPDQPGVAGCQRCRKRLCATCRTRWHEQSLCLECVEKSIAAGEEHPRETKSRRGQAVRGILLASFGLILLVLGLAIFAGAIGYAGGSAVLWAVVIVLASLVPASVGLGQAAAVVLTRGPLLRLATSAVVIAAAQIGVTLSLLLINLWRN